MIVSILNQKGGSGKTTIAVNLARCFNLHSETCLLVDSDPQGSARDWHSKSNGELLELIALDRPTIDKDIKKTQMYFDWIIVDGAPQLKEMAVKTVICSDVVLIPVQPSPYDIWACADIVETIKQRQEITGGSPKAAFIISRQITNTNIGKDIRQNLEHYGFPIFHAGTFQRITYANSVQDGGTVFDTPLFSNTEKHIIEFKQIQNKAIQEIEDIRLELKEFVNASN